MPNYDSKCSGIEACNSIPLEYIKEALFYSDGKLFWNERPLHHFYSEHAQKVWNVRYAGKQAGYRTNHGYHLIRLVYGESQYSVKRCHLVLALHSVPVSKGQVIDHCNGDREDDRLENLRVTTQQMNCCNRGMHSRNTSGHTGMRFRKGKWEVYIQFKKKLMHLGVYSTLEEAIAVRKAKEVELFGEFRRKDETEPPKPLDPFPYEPTPEEEAWLNSIGSL